ncbi:MAG: hypothetical protein IT204_15815 [Fimbriimonadaceae bacterium]|nr:hypothetical protein [Fimbriimonadaceae bacterium]
MASSECRQCGCALHESDVRQVALYYRHERPSMVAVQYVCPRCGDIAWQQHAPGDLETDLTAWATAGGLTAAGWAGRQQQPGDHAVVVEPAPPPPVPVLPISLDEYIDFGCRLARLSPADLSALLAA